MSRPTDAELYLRGNDTLLASWEAYARGAVGAAVKRLPGVTRFAAWVHESDPAMRAEVERRGYTLGTTTRWPSKCKAAVGFRDLGRILEYVPVEGQR